MRAGFRDTVGRAFLLGALVTLPLALLETTLSEPHVSPSAMDLLYGINIHWLVVLAVCFVACPLALRAANRSFPLFVLGGVLAVEFGLFGAYWVAMYPGFPPFHTRDGKLLTAALMLIGALIGLALTLLASRGTRRWIRTAHPPGGRWGLLVLLGLGLLNAGLLIKGQPRGDAVQPPDATLPAERPDVFVILVDTLRRDHVSHFGYGRPTTPHLDALFADALVCTQASTPSSWTIPSVASIFSGLYPSSHRVITGLHQLPAETPTLAEHFRRYGYATGAFIGNGILADGSGFAQGFATYFPQEPPFWCRHHRTALERIILKLRRPGTASCGWKLNEEFFAFLDDTRGEPRFAYIHYMEPHSPYLAPREDRVAVAPGVGPGPTMPPRFADYRDQLAEDECHDWECLEDPPHLAAPDLEGMVANYDAEIHLVDRNIGQLLAGLRERGLLETSHILFCTDHGEEFGDHGGWFHGPCVYEEMTACPLAYHPPGGLPGGAHLERPVALLDALLTLCLRIGLEAPPMHQGVPIPELLGEAEPLRAVPVFSELPPTLYALRLRNWKLVQRGPRAAPVYKLFDLSVDPGELHDLALLEPDTLAYLQGYLQGIVADRKRAALGEVTGTADPEVLRHLRDLGYIK